MKENTILTQKQISDIAKALTVTAKNYINVNEHIFYTIVTHVISTELIKIDAEANKNE